MDSLAALIVALPTAVGLILLASRLWDEPIAIELPAPSAKPLPKPKPRPNAKLPAKPARKDREVVARPRLTVDAYSLTDMVSPLPGAGTTTWRSHARAAAIAPARLGRTENSRQPQPHCYPSA